MVRKVKKYIGIIVIIVIVTMILGCDEKNAKISIEKNELAIQSRKYSQVTETNSNLKEIEFKDTNLYNEIVPQISDYIYQKDDTNRKIYIENENINNIKTLDLNDKRIIKTSGIENFTGLTTLDISSNNIDGLDYISQIKSLKKLVISNCELTKDNIVKLNSLTNLQSLDIAVNKLYDTDNIDKKDSILEQIKGLKNLKYLNASSNYIKNIESLENLTNLETLNLGENNEIKKTTISNLGLLKKLQNLHVLNFSENYTSNIIDNISGLTSLTEVQLEKNNIKSISGIEELTNLVNLNLCGNSITDVKKIAKLTKLEVIRLGNNDIKDISPLYNSTNNSSVYSNLEKLDISANPNLENNEALKYFCKESQNKQIELDYEYITDTTMLPHYDSDGVAYVTYSDFGARCDGIYDDYIAIRNAHIYANSANCEVRIKDTKSYHIYHYYGSDTVIGTNTDLGNSNIIIHDEKIDTVSGRFNHLFRITNGKDIKAISKPKWTIKKNQKNIPELQETLNELKEYSKFMCIVENTNKKMYIRSGTNTNNGSSQKDIFCVDSNGNTLNDIQWDFDEITSITILPVQKNEIIIKNGNFLSKAVKSGNEAHNSISGSGKPVYFSRGIDVNVASNVNILNINHKLEENDKISGSYRGFLNANICTDLEIKDCNLVARKYLGTGRSTYDLNMNTSVNLRIENVVSDNIDDSQRWGIVGSNFTKDVTYKNCKLNRIDAHQGVYNLNIKDCTIGIQGLTLIGQGDLKIERTSVESNTFIQLRSDYGSTWNGNVYIDNCKYIHVGTTVPKFIQHTFKWEKDSNGNKKIHDYGYECKFPNLYVNNFTIDLKNSKEYNYMEIISNSTQNYDSTYDYDYWPKDIHFNNYKFINNKTGKSGTNIKFCAQKLAKKEGENYNYSLTNCTINAGKQPVTLRCMKGICKTTSPIDFSINYIDEGKNLATLYEDDVLNNKYSKFDVKKGNVINESLNSDEYEKYKIVINSQVTEESGTYSGKAVFVMKQVKYDIKYSIKEITNQDVTVKIISNEEIKPIKGWNLSEDKKTLTKTYSENTNEEIEVCDYAGNKTKKTIKIDNIDKIAPITEVSYSTTSPTNQDVVATIKANEEMQTVEGWTLSKDKKSMTKTYSENTAEKIIIKDLLGNEVAAIVNITNIDKKAPTPRVNYNTTGENVTVTIIADEKIQQIEGWTIDETQTILKKIFTANAEEKVIIKDLAGNTNVVEVKVTNIEQGEIEANVEYSTTVLTNQNIIVTVTINREIQEVQGWELSQNKKVLTKTFEANAEEEIEIQDITGNTKKVLIKVANIDKRELIAEVTYSTTNPTNQDIVATINADEEMQAIEGWTLSEDKKSMEKTYSGNVIEKIIVKDLAGNETTVTVNISNIDKKIPTAQVSYNTVDGNVIVTITSNKKIQQIEGWTIDETQTILTKIFTANAEETVVIKDLAGNTNIAEVKVTNIEQGEIEAKVEYSTTILTNQNVKVTITSNRKIKPVDGWTLSTDKKVLTKVFESNAEEEIEIEDSTGNVKKVLVKVANIDKKVPIAEVSYSTTKTTNQDVVVTINTDKEIQAIEGWAISENKKSITKTYSKNITENIEIEDLTGNKITVNINILNIDKEIPTMKVNYTKTDGNVIVTITSNKKIQQIEGWRIDETQTILTKIFTANAEETVVIKDLAGNTNIAEVKVTNIEQGEIEAKVEYSTTVLTNQNVTVTVTSNKEIQEVQGWTLSTDKKVLTKVFESNAEEEIEIQDITGNTRKVLIKVANIDKRAPIAEVTYSTTKITDKEVIVTIKTDEEVQAVEGWSLSEDKRNMTKTYSKNTTETIMIQDLANNGTEVNIEINNIKEKSNIGNKSISDDTTAKSILPNTSGEKIFLTVLIVIVVACSGIIYIKLKSYKDIK